MYWFYCRFSCMNSNHEILTLNGNWENSPITIVWRHATQCALKDMYLSVYVTWPEHLSSLLLIHQGAPLTVTCKHRWTVSDSVIDTDMNT